MISLSLYCIPLSNRGYIFIFPLLVGISTIFISQFNQEFKITLSFLLNLLGEKKFVKSVKPFRHKINKPNAKLSTRYWFICLYSIIICYNIFVTYFLISFRIFLALKLSKYVQLFSFTYNHIQWVSLAALSLLLDKLLRQ